MKKTKKILALALALIMCMSLVPAAALAESTPPAYKIVSIGDSTSNGFCLDDYGSRSGAKWNDTEKVSTKPDVDAYGFMDYASKISTGQLMANYLQEVMPDKNVVLDNLTLEGMRTDELRALLDPSYIGDEWCVKHIENYTNKMFYSYNLHFPGYDSLSDLFIDKITDADLVIMDCCTNNFGTYVEKRIKGDFQNKDSVIDVADSLVPGFKQMAEDAIAKYFSSFKGILPEGTVKELVDTISYVFTSMCANFSVDVAKILELNPDVKLVAVGPFNIMQGLTASVNGIDLDLSRIWGLLIDLANTYITSLDPNNGRFYYADVMDGIDMLVKPISEGTFTQFYKDDIKNAFGSDSAEVLAVVSKAASYTKLDLTEAIALLSGGGKTLENATKAAAGKALAEGWDKLSSTEQSLMHIYTRFFINNGSGTHPSESGYVQKFEAVKAAYNSNTPASGKAGDVAADAGIHAAVGIINTLKAPIVNAINKLFSFIDLGNFFAQIFDGVSQFLLRLRH